MTTPGPYQYCSECGKERAHNWVAETTYACTGCGKETKVNFRKPLEKIGAVVMSPVQEGLFHLDSEALANVQQSMNVIQERLEEVKEIIEDKGFVTELPKMGHEVKHTPLDEEIQYLAQDSKVQEVMNKLSPPPTEGKPLESARMYFIDTEEYNGEANIQHVEQPVQKGWADGL